MSDNKPSVAHLHYIAGYLDGEATIGYWGNLPEIRIESCNPASLRVISKYFGNEVKSKPLRKNVKWRPSFIIQYKGAKAVDLLSKVSAYMVEKKKQAENCLKMYELHQELHEDKRKLHQ